MRLARSMHRTVASVFVAAMVAACGGGEPDSASAPGEEAAEATEGDAAASAAGIADVADDTVADEAAQAAAATPPRTTIESAIAAAAAAGEIDADTALAYRTYALFGDARLPERLRAAGAPTDDVDEVDGNAVIEELHATWDRLAPATRAALAPFRIRPGAAGSGIGGDPGTEAVRRSALLATQAREAALARPTCSTSAAWGNVAGSVAPVRVWYDKTRSADLTQARAMIAALDTKIWPTLVGTLGFKAPQSDLPLACDGGDARLDLYIVAGLGSRGATIAESASLRQSSTYVLLRSGLSGGALDYQLTHQFMHAVMWAYSMAADQPSYGWMRNALANWAVEAVYPGNATLLADATCLMNSNFLSITSRSTGACSASTSRTRDYGACLLYQYIGRTAGKTKVRELLAATATRTTALDAIEALVTGGLRTLWPKFAKTLWNKAPVTNAGRPAFRNWDGQTAVPQLAPDHPTTVNANRGALAEASTSLSDVVANVSTRYYRFTFSDTTTRTLMFRNSFYPLYKAGKKVSVQALWRAEGGNWVEENWSAKEWIGFCRDRKAQRLAELVVIVASGEVGSVTMVDAATQPTFKRNNIGCWGYAGTASRTDKHGSWSSGSIVVSSTPRFDHSTSGGQYNDAATGRLRVPIAAPLFRSAGWTLAEAYTDDGCNYALNRSGTGSSTVVGGNAFGSIVINNFAESLPGTLRQQQAALVGTVRGAYTANAGSTLFGLTGTVTGPQPRCGTSYESAPSMFVLSNENAGSGPVVRLDGHLAGSRVAASGSDTTTWTWDLAPLREP
jgi:GNAT superfamily N-acetyltransferase